MQTANPNRWNRWPNRGWPPFAESAIPKPSGPDSARSPPDHHIYTDHELDELAVWADQHQADVLVTTRKDLVKIPRARLRQTPLWAIDTAVEWISGRNILEDAVARALGETNLEP